MSYRQKRRKVHAYRTGALAQLVSFIAVVLPILFRDTDALVLLVSSSALATLLVTFFGFSSQSLVPASTSPNVALTRSLIGATGLILQFVIFTTLSIFVGEQVSSLIFITSLLCLCQGFFILALSISTYFGTVQVFYGSRVIYSFTLLTGNAICGFLSYGPYVYALVPSVAYVAGTIFFIFSLNRSNQFLTQSISSIRSLYPSFFHQIKLSFRLVLAVSLGTFVTQLPAIVVAFLGPYREAWSVVIRLSSGFQTIAGQVITPIVIESVVKARNASDRKKVQHIIRSAYIAGAFLALIMFLTVLLGLYWQDGIVLTSLQWTILYFCILAESAFTLFSSTTSRLLEIVGGTRQRLRWEFWRVFFTILLLFLIAVPNWLLYFSVFSLVSRICYLILLRKQVQRL